MLSELIRVILDTFLSKNSSKRRKANYSWPHTAEGLAYSFRDEIRSIPTTSPYSDQYFHLTFRTSIRRFVSKQLIEEHTNTPQKRIIQVTSKRVIAPWKSLQNQNVQDEN